MIDLVITTYIIIATILLVIACNIIKDNEKSYNLYAKSALSLLLFLFWVVSPILILVAGVVDTNKYFKKEPLYW